MASIYARRVGIVPEADKSIHAAGNQAASAPASVAAGPGPGAPDLEAASTAGLTYLKVGHAYNLHTVQLP